MKIRKINRMNKKAFIRIIEAVIAIMIIMGAVLFFAAKQNKKIDISEDVYEKQRQILEIVANNPDMRKEIIDVIINGEVELFLTNDYISKNLPRTWNYAISVCKVDEVCGKGGTPIDRDIYVSETIISANIDNYPNQESRKLVFFIWRK